MSDERRATDDPAATDGSDAPPRPRVLVDAMCGSLARHLRICGYDAAYALDRGIEADGRLRAVADDEDRVLITRDRELAAATDDAVLVTELDVLDQLHEVAASGLPVELPAEPRRCGACNGRLDRVDEPPTDGRPTYVPDDIHPVWRCQDCDQWFWKGSHWDHVASRIETLSSTPCVADAAEDNGVGSSD